ncbi:uncharacterized protein METZ01_LOCUS188509 [marine metagenome]|uniref:Uncharacterized protein n=1 Tax=marine metagenome TaxID=408172 RepID=A0A382DBM6_9ZZZZ
MQGEWEHKNLKPNLKQLVNSVLTAVASGKAKEAMDVVTEAFENVKSPELICVDSGINKIEKKDKTPFGLVDAFVMAMALGSNGKYIRADDLKWNGDKTPLLLRGLGKTRIIKRCIKEGRDFYFMDTGYLGNNPCPTNPLGRKRYHRIVKNALQNLHMPPKTDNLSKAELDPTRIINHAQSYDGEKWKRLGISFKDVQGGNKILIVPPSDKVMKFFDIDLDRWVDETILKLQKHTQRQIVIRKKPNRTDRVTIDTMEQALTKDIYCIVTYNSIAALEAMVYGKPALVLGPNCAQDICETKIERIEFLQHPGRKQLNYLCRYLSNNQFTYNEMLNGSAWSKIK